MAVENKPIFRDLNPDDPDQEATEVESLCMNCYSKVCSNNFHIIIENNDLTSSLGCYSIAFD